MQIYCLYVGILVKTRLLGWYLAYVRQSFPTSRDFYNIESQGLSRRIIVVWRSGIVDIDVFLHCSQQICIVVFKMNSAPWLLSGIYASASYKERRELA